LPFFFLLVLILLVFSLSSFARVKGLLSSVKSFGFPSFSEGVDFSFFLFLFPYLFLPFLSLVFSFLHKIPFPYVLVRAGSGFCAVFFLFLLIKN